MQFISWSLLLLRIRVPIPYNFTHIGATIETANLTVTAWWNTQSQMSGGSEWRMWVTRPFVFPVGSWSWVHLDTDTGLAAEEDAAAAYSELIVFLRRRRPKSGNTLLTICMDVGQTNKQQARRPSIPLLHFYPSSAPRIILLKQWPFSGVRQEGVEASTLKSKLKWNCASDRPQCDCFLPLGAASYSL